MASATFNEGVSLVAPPPPKAAAADPGPTVPSPHATVPAGGSNETVDTNKGNGKGGKGGNGMPSYQKTKKSAKCLVSRVHLL